MLIVINSWLWWYLVCPVFCSHGYPWFILYCLRSSCQAMSLWTMVLRRSPWPLRISAWNASKTSHASRWIFLDVLQTYLCWFKLTPLPRWLCNVHDLFEEPMGQIGAVPSMRLLLSLPSLQPFLFSRTHGSWQPRILRPWPLRKGLYSSLICLCVCHWESFKVVQHWIVYGTNIVCSLCLEELNLLKASFHNTMHELDPI